MDEGSTSTLELPSIVLPSSDGDLMDSGVDNEDAVDHEVDLGKQPLQTFCLLFNCCFYKPSSRPGDHLSTHSSS